MRRRAVLIFLGSAMTAILMAATSPASAKFDYVIRTTGQQGGEPTLGIFKNGAIFAQALEKVVKSTDEGKSWKVVHVPPTQDVTLDPYIHVDAKTQRIISTQLLGACQEQSLSDDGGKTWVDVATQCPAGDHQKIGSGPWFDDTNRLYPRSVYTCLNDVGDTACAMSLDGGLTWLPPVPVFPGFDPEAEDGLDGVPGFCGGLEGDPVSGPDGTIYLPREYCGRPFLGVSKDDGVTWTLHYVAPGSKTRPIAWGGNNPSVAVDKAGTLYYAWTGADWRHRVSFSKNDGETWSKPVVVSSAGGSTTFPTIIAGDDGRVATAFFGTPSIDKGPDEAPEEARWFLYVSFSGNADSKDAEWSTRKASRSDVQIGCIGRHGATCPHGNLLDFMDAALMPDGRLVIVYPDGCVQTCDEYMESTSAMVRIALQTRGPRLR